MGGIKSLAFDYFNNGDGKIESSGLRVFDFFVKFRLEGPYLINKYDGNVYGENITLNQHGEFVPNIMNLDGLDVTKADSIAIVSYANIGNNTAPYFSGITLELEEYGLNITTGNMMRTKYKLADGIFTKDSTIEFSPGSFFIKQINSNVGNNQDYSAALGFPTEAKAFRSDRIEFGYKYNNENPNGNYAHYTGFEVKGIFKDYWGDTTDKWIYHEGTELVLDGDFFKTQYIWEGIKDGTIEIRPVFAKTEAALELKVNDNMTLGNIGTAKSFINTGAPKLYKGDVISGLEITSFNENTSKLPAWTSYLEKADIPGKPGNSGVAITDTNRHTKIDYTLEGSYNTLSINLRTTLILKANPNEYKNGLQMLPYKIDGIAYPDRAAFTDKIEEIYTSWEDAGIPDMDPTIEMEFKYLYDTSFPDSQGEAKFGSPRKAYVNVYQRDGIRRSTHPIDCIDGTFKLTGKLKELLWESDDFASVAIEGSTVVDGQYVSTKEIVIDFLVNSADGVLVLPPDSEQTKEVWEGNIQNPVVIETANPLDFFNMKAIMSPGFVAKWIDFSPDANNSGELEPGEKEVLEERLRERMNDYSIKIDEKLDQRVYTGSDFSYMPQFFNPSRIYYLFDKRQPPSTERTITIQLSEQHSTVLRPDALTTARPLRNAEVYIGAKRVYDDNNGIYIDKGYNYEALAYYLGQVFYKKQIFNIPAQVGNTVSQVINPSSLVRPDSSTFKAQYLVGGKKTDPFNPLGPANPILNLSEDDTVFSYKMKENAGVKVNDSFIRIYDEDDKLCLETMTGHPDKDGTFTKAINTFDQNISEGSYMTIAGVYTELKVTDDGIPDVEVIVHEYPEVDVGLIFKKPLTSLSLISSFKVPFQNVIDIVGKVNNQFDLGLDINVEKNIKSADYTDKAGIHRYIRYVNIGFNKTYEKKFIDNTKNETGTVKGNDTAVKEEVDSKSQGQLKNAANAASTGAETKPGTKNTGGGVLTMPYKVSILLVLELGQEVDENGDYKAKAYDCLSSLVIMATANAEYRTERTYMTPIGLPVTITLSAGGGASAAVVFDAKGNDRYNAKYRLDSKGTASLTPSNYDIYSKFVLTPYIELDAGTGYGYMKLNLTGRADFDFYFNVPILGDSKSSGGGSITEISATLKVKMLFAQKKWTLYKSKRIDLFSYGRYSSDELASALNDPYRSFMYEKVEPLEDDEIMSRDYLSVRGEWGESGNGGLLSPIIDTATENLLQAGVFPHPQTKLIQIDEERTLLLFVEDDIERDERNRASLMYSIMEGGNATAPVSLDNDGTWDEDPDAFVIDDRIFITWSDAGRTFTETDTEHDVLSAMNISATWLDLQTEEFDEEFSVTRSVYGGDDHADINPKISYDPVSERLMVFYTKTDHSDRWDVDPLLKDPAAVPHYETPEPLYGDIVNGYSAIAYRYAEYDDISDEFIWSDTYDPGETLDADKYYGQRFPKLAPPADIVEVEHDIEEVVNVGGKNITFTHRGTDQTVKTYTGLSDPRIEDMDLITYDGLAVFAYIIDYDGDLNTQQDYKLYIQTYDYSSNEFSYPIEIVNDTEEVQDTKPRFIRAEGNTYLYWLRDGNIVYTRIDDILGNDDMLKEAIVPGTSPVEKFYMIDKTDTAKDAHINVAVDHEDMIDDYSIASNGSSIYALWTEKQTSYNDGLKAGDPGTEEPESIQKESHLFAACDVPSFPWSKPVQITSDPGANYSDLSFTVLEDESFLATYVKYIQEYDEATGHYTEDNSVRSLVVNTFTNDSMLELGEISTETEYTMPGEEVEIEAILSNNGLKAAEDIYYQYYTMVNSMPYSESNWYPEKEIKETEEPHYIMGGSDETIYGNPIMPDSLDGVESLKVGFRLKNKAGDIIATQEKDLPIGPKLQIYVFEGYLTDKDEALINLYVENIGNKDFKDTFSITAGGKTLHTEQYELQVKEEKSISFKVGLKGASFGESSRAEDGGYFDELKLNYNFGGFEATGDIKRSISAQDYAEMQKVESLRIKRNGTPLQNGSRMFMNNEDIILLESEILKKTGAVDPENLEVEWSSDDQSVIAVTSEGVLVPMGIGTATVTAALQPALEKAVSYASGAFMVTDAGYTIPEGAKKKVSFTAIVRSDSDDSDNNDRRPVPKPVSGTIQTGERVEGEKLTLIFDDAALSEALNGITDTLNFSSSNASANIKQLEMVLSATNLRLISESSANRVTISSTIGNISFDRAAIAAIAAAAEAGDKQAVISFSVKDGIIEIMVTVDGKRVMNLNGGAILVSTGHIPDENLDANSIVVYDISEEGTRKLVKASLYRSETGEMLFRISTTGRYVIGYNKVEFTDDLGWAENYINLLSSRNIIMGAGEGKFLKDKEVTRAEFITMLSRISDDLQLSDTSTKFSDVAPDAWYAAQVKWAYENGIVNGTSDTEFSPENSINREEMATMIFRYINYARIKLLQGKADEFKDKEQLSSWSAAAVNAMKAAGFMVGTGDNNFEPGRTSSRAEAAKVVAEILRSLLN